MFFGDEIWDYEWDAVPEKEPTDGGPEEIVPGWMIYEGLADYWK